MLAVTIVMATIDPVMVTLLKEAEPLIVYAQHVLTGFLLKEHHVILIHSTVEAVHNNASIETVVMINIHMQSQYLGFAQNGWVVSEPVALAIIQGK